MAMPGLAGGGLLLLFLLLLAGSAAADDQFVHSNDELGLSYAPQGSESQLCGEPGTLQRLVLILHNNGPAGKFLINQTSSHEGFVGRFPPELEVSSGEVRTIVIRDLPVPTSVDNGEQIDITVTAKRRGLAITSKMKSVSLTLLFTVGEEPKSRASDLDPPEAGSDYGGECPVAANDTALCSGYSYHLEFHVRDEESGLRSVTVEAAGSRDRLPRPVLYEYTNFPIGSTEQVDVMSDVSCCAAGVRLTAVDMAGNEVNREFMQGESSAPGLPRLDLRLSLAVSLAAFSVLR